MKSPVVVDKPPEYHGKTDNNIKERGLPFEDEEGGADPWSDLVTRHPEIAAHLRQHQHRHPSTWARKRRPSSQDAEDFGNSFGGFAGFPFEDVPRFREHLPSHWNRPFGPRDEQPPPPPTAPSPPRQQSAATQTERAPPPASALPQYGLRNTVDLGQSSAAAGLGPTARGPRSMSAPPEGPAMSDERAPAHVRHIPIMVEGRDEPLCSRPAVPDCYARGVSPQRAQSPRSHGEFRQIPVQHEDGTSHAKGQPQQHQRQQQQQHPQQQQQQQQRPPQQQQQQQQQAPQPPPEQPTSSPAKSAPSPADPITQILTIQTEVLNLMTEVENFTGTKKDKKYKYLDEMLTRNLIKLDNIETEGKENIRNARKEAIKCIHKCIAVLEAKAESNDVQAQNADMKAENGGVEMKEDAKAAENGAVEMKEPSKAEKKTEDPSNEKPQPQVDLRQYGEENTKKTSVEKADTGTKSTKKKQTKATDNDTAVDNDDNASKGVKSDDKEQKNEEAMQVDDKVNKEEVQSMDVDDAASQ